MDSALITALTYNVHECVGVDKRRDPSRIARVIIDSGAQIVGLQEVHSETGGAEDLHQVNYLAAATGLHPVPGPTLERRNGQYGNLLLTSGNVRAVRKLDLSFPGQEPRGAIDADLEFNGEIWRVVVTHLGLRAVERRFQVKRILAVLKKRRTPKVILLTDLNEWRFGARPLRWLQAELGQNPSVRTYPSRYPALALDRIWVSPSSALVKVCAVRNPVTRVASDHLPLKARLRTLEPTPQGLHGD